MSGKRLVIDSDIIIFASKGQIDVNQLLEDFDKFYVSIITYMEVYGYQFESEDEKLLLDELFVNLEIVDVNKPITDQVVIYRIDNSKKIKLPDAIILATANYLKADLITNNTKDFENFDDNVKLLDASTFRAC